MPPVDDLLTPQEAADRLRVTAKTIKRWADEGALSCVTLPSGRIRIPASEVQRLLSAAAS